MNKIAMISIFLLVIFSSCISNREQITPTPNINETPIENISTSDITQKHFPYKPPITPVPTINITPSQFINQTINQTIDNKKMTNLSIIPTNEYEIYSTVLILDKSKDKVVIRQKTANITYCFDNNTNCIDSLDNATQSSNQNSNQSSNQNMLDKDLINDFKTKNLDIYSLENKFSIPQRVFLISENELNDLFQIPNWDAFYEKYPNSSGIIELSRVGFNNNYTQALLYYGKYSGLVEGAGYIILLDKDDNKWVISRQAMLWVS